VQPLAGDRFYVRLLSEAGDLAAVRCHFADKYAGGLEGALPLVREASDGISDYWSGVLPMPTSRLRYFFELTDTDGQTRFFDEHGFLEGRPARKHYAGYFFYPYDLPIDRFALPAWVAGRTFYLVFPDRFANGDQMNDPAWKRPWGEAPTAKSFFGGDIPGIRQNLGWLSDLGVGGSTSHRSSPRHRITSTTRPITSASIPGSARTRTSPALGARRAWARHPRPS